MATQSSSSGSWPSHDADGCPYDQEAVTEVPERKRTWYDSCDRCGAPMGTECNPFCPTLTKERS